MEKRTPCAAAYDGGVEHDGELYLPLVGAQGVAHAVDAVNRGLCLHAERASDGDDVLVNPFFSKNATEIFRSGAISIQQMIHRTATIRGTVSVHRETEVA